MNASRFTWIGLLLTAACSACGGGGEATGASRGTTTPETTAPPRSYASISVLDPEVRSLDVRGAIASITPEELAAGVTASRVEIEGDGPVEQRAFRVVVSPPLPLPFRVGDRIHFRLETLPGPPTYQPQNRIVTTESGEILVMNGVTPPAGWQIEPTGEAAREHRDGYDEIEKVVTFAHDGRTATSDRMRWTRIRGSDGDWHVAGSATDLEGDALPPDGGPTFAFMILRAVD